MTGAPSGVLWVGLAGQLSGMCVVVRIVLVLAGLLLTQYVVVWIDLGIAGLLTGRRVIMWIDLALEVLCIAWDVFVSIERAFRCCSLPCTSSWGLARHGGAVR